MPKIPAGWTKAERWVWKQIADGYAADLNTHDDADALDPKNEEGWGEERRVSSEFLQTILTRKEFVEATPCGGARVLGALIDNAPLALAYARLQHSLWLDNSRILVEVRCNGIRIDGELSFDGSYFQEAIHLNSATVSSNLFLRRVTLEGGVDLRTAHIGSNIETNDSTFGGDVILDSTTVAGTAFFETATFNDGLNLVDANIGSALYLRGSTFEGRVYLTGCQVTGDFLLGFSEESAARWGDYASLTLRNTRVGALQDWWQDSGANAWPPTYRVEGFTYDCLGTIGTGKDADMLKRPVDAYIEWLQGDPGSSPQPYEHLADRFRKAGEPHKATSILYAARQRQRRRAWSTRTDDHGNPNPWFWLPALGLSILELTIGYGLGNRYFRVLWWVGSLTLLGMFVLIFFGSHAPTSWARLLFASLDQLLPIVTLDRAHDVLIFGNPGANPPVGAQPYGVLLYFYAHKLLGWVLGSFLIAGLGGLTQRN